MHDLQTLSDIRALESFLGHSHQCFQCGRTFLAHEDGCPICGRGARVASLSKPHSFNKNEGRLIGWYISDPITKDIIQVSVGDSSPWPKA